MDARTLTGVAAALALVLGAWACGDDGASTETEAATQSTETSAPGTETEAGSEGSDSDSEGVDPQACPPDLGLCEGGGCPAAPESVTVPEWFDRLSESPPIVWTGGGERFEVSVGTEPGATDVACWREALGPEYRFLDLWLDDDAEYYANVRSVTADGTGSAPVSAKWRVDVKAPDGLEVVDADAVPVDGTLSWSGEIVDSGSGVLGFQYAIGTQPLADDVVAWSETVPAGETSAVVEGALTEGSRYFASLRVLDTAGNRSNPIGSKGFIACPGGYVWVPGIEALGGLAEGFCAAKYEMKVPGNDNGIGAGFMMNTPPESRVSGTPWTGAEREEAVALCVAAGAGYSLLSNGQWQTIARNIESVASNWSGGTVGAGTLNRGHSDGTPATALAASDDGSPCEGTGQSGCADPNAPGFPQKRTHSLSNGAVIWDLAGNAWEFVSGSQGAHEGLWSDYDAPAYTQQEGWEELRARFAPLGDYNADHGVGRIYGGASILARGGAAVPAQEGSGGSKGQLDTGVFGGHHNSWQVTNAHGFRCAYVTP